jgi:predicted MFS family arabinose efflux permease
MLQAIFATATARTPMTWTLMALAVGAFAIGTQGFGIAVLVPLIARDLGVSVPAAGQLVTAYALVYALGSPILTAALGGVARRRLLLWSMAGFVAANIVAAFSPGFYGLVAARVGIALSSGLFMPIAFAFAATTADSGRPGRALSVIGLGLTLSMVVGVPLATFVASEVDWRWTFGFVALVGAACLIGVGKTVDAGAAPAVSLMERIRVARDGPILRALLVTMLWSMATYAVLPYLAAFLEDGAGVRGKGFTLVMLVSGVSGVIGMRIGGVAADRFGPDRVRIASLFLLAVALMALSAFVLIVPHGWAGRAVLAPVVLWGMAAWAFQPAQQAKLVALDPAAAPVSLSLNQSALYLGGAFGASLGAVTVKVWSATEVGWAGAVCALLALLWLLWWQPTGPEPGQPRFGARLRITPQ